MNRSVKWYHVCGGILLFAFAIKFLDMGKAISGMSKKIDDIKYCTDNAYIPIMSMESWVDAHFDDYYPGD